MKKKPKVWGVWVPLYRRLEKGAIVHTVCLCGHVSLGVYVLVSYPDPNVRNDDHRLQYDITYRGSGNEVVLGMSLECTLLHNSCVVTNSDYVTNSKSIWTTAKCAVLRSQIIDLDGYYKITRLVGKG